MTQNWPPQQPNPQQPYPPQPGYGFPQPGAFPIQRSNGWAITSLVCGLLGCIPVVTSLLAIVFGILGIRKSNQPQTSGKGLAITGLVLGLLGVVGWAVFAGGAVMLYRTTAQPRNLARTFAQNLASGNVEAAMAQTSGTITREEIAAASQTLQNAGTLTNVSIVGFHWNEANGAAEWNLNGIANFSSAGTKNFSLVMTRQGTDFKITKFQLE